MLMPRPRLALLVLGLVAASVWAQTAPPIKPGLWEIQTGRDVDGKKAPDPGDRLKNLPPAQRAQIEAMMKQRGVALSNDGSATVKICLSADSLAHGGWQGSDRSDHAQNERCKSEVTERNGSTWKWHAACTDPEVVSDGVAEFTNGESYTVHLTNVTKAQGMPRTTQMSIAAKWLGASCGDLKPAGAKP
ncbi:MAG: DUF3617 domain-containing protein [Proteobacteria bacterium]|nr:DUF3617 domain-containing protein [Pseudomonadota bacterium]